jgi:hypothetical protein
MLLFFIANCKFRNPIIFNHYLLVKKYLDYRKLQMGSSYSSDSQIIDIDKNSVNRLIKTEVIRILGESWKGKNVSSHIFRRSKATNSYANGIRPEIIQRDGGWTSLKTLDSYIKIEKTTPHKQLEELKQSMQDKSNKKVSNKVFELTQQNTQLSSNIHILQSKLQESEQRDLNRDFEINSLKEQLNNLTQMLIQERATSNIYDSSKFNKNVEEGLKTGSKGIVGSFLKGVEIQVLNDIIDNKK